MTAAFDAPFVLGLAPVVAALVWLAAAWARRGRIRRAVRWSPDAARLARAGAGGPPALALAALLGAVALAGPRWGEERVLAETRGLALVIAVDISRSMLAQDTRPSRLARAAREARRLVQDLPGDRIGLLAFAGSSYILSPLSIDGSALLLYLEALDPGMASEGGTGLAAPLRQGAELLDAGTEPADRVLVVFTDGEAHDSLGGALVEAQRLASLGIRLILVAQGRPDPVRIPLYGDDGALLGFQEDETGADVLTRRRDDVLGAVADAGRGTIVAAELPDQAGAVRELVASYKRARQSEARTRQGRPRAWVAVLAATAVLLLQAVTRRTAALIAVALVVGAGATAMAAAQAPPGRPRSAAERAWDRGDWVAAARAYLAEWARTRDDAAAYNAGTAALAADDGEPAREHLTRAAASLDPDVRFRALYNLGLLGLRLGERDSVHRDAHLAAAERAYREALLLRPDDDAAKWNLELTVRRRGAGGGPNPPRGPSPPPPPGAPPPRPRAGLTRAQADELLRSVGQTELDTRRDRVTRVRRVTALRGKDW